MLARLEQLSSDKNEMLKRSIIRNEGLYYSPFCSEFKKAKMHTRFILYHINLSTIAHKRKDIRKFLLSPSKVLSISLYVLYQ